jgi:hypothetical protein
MTRDHADHLSASGQCSVGNGTHQTDLSTTIDQANTGVG